MTDAQKKNEELAERLLTNAGIDLSKWEKGSECEISKLSECPFDRSHTNGDAKLFVYDAGQIAFKCHHDSCKGKKWEDVRKLIDPEYRGTIKVNHKKDKSDEPKEITPFITQKASDLKNKPIQPVEYVIENLLPYGLVELIGDSKVGKSWMALQIATAVADGRDFWGYRVTQGNVLYLALEDTEARMQRRLYKQGFGFPEALEIAYDAAVVGEGAIEQITEFLNREGKNVRLVIIDVLQKIRGFQSPKKSAYGQDYDFLTPIKDTADKAHICILCLHHTNKKKDESDQFQRISGTTGIQGASDAALLISKAKRADKEATLFTSGRDFEDLELRIEFDASNCTWVSHGDANSFARQKLEEEFNNSPVIQTITRLVKAEPSGEWENGIRKLREALYYYFPNYNYLKDAAIKREIDKFGAMLYSKRDIIYTSIENGSGGKKYRFAKKKDGPMVENVKNVENVDENLAAEAEPAQMLAWDDEIAADLPGEWVD